MKLWTGARLSAWAARVLHAHICSLSLFLVLEILFLITLLKFKFSVWGGHFYVFFAPTHT